MIIAVRQCKTVELIIYMIEYTYLDFINKMETCQSKHGQLDQFASWYKSIENWAALLLLFSVGDNGDGGGVKKYFPFLDAAMVPSSKVFFLYNANLA